VSRQRPTRKGQGQRGQQKHLRFTYLMSPTMERNLAFYAFQAGITKQESVTRALEGLLREAGLDPTKIPTVSVTYPEGS
jgi:hypothetical protein